ALARLMKGRTTFVIAQRLTTLRQADRIVVLERGRIVDEGGHDELLARSRIYREIYELQFRPQEEERCRAWARAGAVSGLDGTGGER
ncbi:MAG TPA: hypothetical protein DHW14_08850, partial [Clostridiales bacterium]|nr:hypothetical protein [Clostridiales bacterium]